MLSLNLGQNRILQDAKAAGQLKQIAFDAISLALGAYAEVNPTTLFWNQTAREKKSTQIYTLKTLTVSVPFGYIQLFPAATQTINTLIKL